jgi:hypothetical protein
MGWETVWPLPEEYRWAAGLLGLLLIVMTGWFAGSVRKSLRSKSILRALNDSSRGKIAPQRGPGAGGFVAEIRPAPEPYRWFWAEYRPRSWLNIMDLVLRIISGHGDWLVLRADLPERPSAELIWLRGQVPGRALGKGPGRGLWMSRRLDFLNTEYATRGVNTGALERAFTDVQTRFGPFVRRFRIQADENPEVEVVVSMAGLNMEDVPALITMLRTAGRAALRR